MILNRQHAAGIVSNKNTQSLKERGFLKRRYCDPDLSGEACLPAGRSKKIYVFILTHCFGRFLPCRTVTLVVVFYDLGSILKIHCLVLEYRDIITIAIPVGSFSDFLYDVASHFFFGFQGEIFLGKIIFCPPGVLPFNM